MTTTPQDLLATIARALDGGASADDRRAGRHACIVLASALGEPGAPMAPPSANRPRIDGGQLLDLAMVKMRAFLTEQDAAQAAPPVTPATSSTATTPTAANPTTPTAANTANPTPTATRPAMPATSSPRPRQPALHIPLVGRASRKR